ncbi:MAG: ABC transporter permease [Rhodocyclaceae bacterium]|nr:ABC transporter permease [Dechloromonas sp.]TEX49197.1 MAG: ABC transporter permease [Rhodocyclaceae bacterium]
MLPRLHALWTKETLALLRDRHGLAALFVMPVIFILVMTMALHDAFMPGASIDVAYAVVDLDNSPQSQALVRRLDKSGSFRRIAVGQDLDAARQGIRENQYALVLGLPAKFGERLLAPAGADGQPTEPLTLLVDPTLNPALQLAFRNQTAAALGTIRADELTRRAGKLFGLPVSPAAERDWPDEIVSIAVQNQRSIRPPSSVQQNVPAWLVFAMFFVVIPIASIFIIERQEGTLQRLRAIGLPFGHILAGKLLPFFVVNQLQAVLMVLVGMFIVPMLGGEALHMPAGRSLIHWWLVAASVSLAAVAFALLVASLTRTSQQAVVVGGVGNILMGAVGGIMVPKFMMPAAMQRLAEWSPMAWGLDGFHTVMLRQGGFDAILPDLLKLLTFAALSLTAAVWLNRSSQP